MTARCAAGASRRQFAVTQRRCVRCGRCRI